MRPRQHRWMRPVAAITLLLTVISVARSNVNPPVSNQKKLCYCGCDMAQDAPMCTKMCELPKYQNRSWATSCQKIKGHASSPNHSAPQSNSKKSNRTQDASLILPAAR